MRTRKTPVLTAAVAAACLAGGALYAQQPPERRSEDSQQAERGAMESMMPGHHHASAHMRLTAPRPPAPEDAARADELVQKLRAALVRYKDYRVAIADGYQPFLPQIPQPEYHFMNYRDGFLAAFTFDPTRPTSLLYRKTADGYALAGAMFTMPRTAGEDQLNARVPLSVAQWHLHVNLCMPPRGQGAQADWTKFGLQGSIANAEACTEAGGRFLPVIFGWMVHVYPFEDSPEKIWHHH